MFSIRKNWNTKYIMWYDIHILFSVNSFLYLSLMQVMWNICRESVYLHKVFFFPLALHWNGIQHISTIYIKCNWFNITHINWCPSTKTINFPNDFHLLLLLLLIIAIWFYLLQFYDPWFGLKLRDNIQNKISSRYRLKSVIWFTTIMQLQTFAIRCEKFVYEKGKKMFFLISFTLHWNV